MKGCPKCGSSGKIEIKHEGQFSLDDLPERVVLCCFGKKDNDWCLQIFYWYPTTGKVLTKEEDDARDNADLIQEWPR